MKGKGLLKRWLVVLGVSISFGLLLTPAQAAPKSIKIGGIYSLTGPDSNLGRQVEAGYQMAIEAINKGGGVYVKKLEKNLPLELVTLDMESSPEKAVSRAETAHSVHKVIAYVGTTYIGAALVNAEKNRVPMIPVACADQTVFERGFKYYFYPLGTAPDLARNTFEILDSIPKANRPTKVVIFEEQTDFGVELSKYYQDQARKRGHKVVTVQKYRMLARDLSPQILKAKSAGAEVALSGPIMPDGISLVRQMKELDYNPKANVMVRAATDISWARALGPLGDYVIVPTGGSHPLTKYPGVAEVTARHQAEFGRTPGPMVLPGYAVIQIIADGIKRAGTLDTTKIRDAIAATDMMTVIGPIKFDPYGKVIKPLRLVLQWQNRKDELIWPPEMMTNALIYPAPKWSQR